MTHKYYRIETYVVVGEQGPILLAPLRRKEGSLYIVGSDKERFDYVDLVYFAEDSERRSNAIETLISYLKGLNKVTRLCASFVAADSPLMNQPMTRVDGEIDNAKIELENFDYAAHFALLSKSVRQNVRTAYNRVSRDGHTISYDELGPTDENYERVYSEAFDCYLNRQTTKYKNVRGVLNRIVLSKCNYISVSRDASFSILGVLRFDEKLAAFYQGFVDRIHMAIQVPRLAIDDTYRFYSPGMLLVNEALKMRAQKRDVAVFDLCRGTEKYKMDMGAEVYKTFNISISL